MDPLAAFVNKKSKRNGSFLLLGTVNKSACVEALRHHKSSIETINLGNKNSKNP
ncbi:hypothetical protein C2W63_01157 [Bacillus velezensis]|nr:hypothetical protein C2W63_01157 [Bacillus velezensis]